MKLFSFSVGSVAFCAFIQNFPTENLQEIKLFRHDHLFPVYALCTTSFSETITQTIPFFSCSAQHHKSLTIQNIHFLGRFLRTLQNVFSTLRQPQKLLLLFLFGKYLDLCLLFAKSTSVSITFCKLFSDSK